MLNLLPQNKKRQIQKEYNGRRLILFFSFAALAIIIWIIFLFPTFLLARAKYDDFNTKDLALNSELNIQKNKETNFTEKQNAMLNVLDKDPSMPTLPTSLLDAVISAKGSNINLTDFSIINNNGLNELLIHGIAVTREDLILFQQTLEKDPLWSKVDLPIGDLGPAKNNEFSITLTIAPK